MPAVNPQDHIVVASSAALSVTEWSLSDKLTLIGVALALIALAFTAYGIRRGNQNSSVASLIAYNEASREAWRRYLAAVKADDATARAFELAELANLLEIGSATDIEGTFVGVSKELLREHLINEVNILNKYPAVVTALAEFVQAPDTFKFLRKFLKKHNLRR